MNSKKNRLGRGLDEIFKDNRIEHYLTNVSREFMAIDIQKIKSNPFQPRKNFDNDKLNELANSIKENGIITPIIVRPYEDYYQIIAGERRYRAAIIASLEQINAVICDINDEQMEKIALIENIQREDLNELEEALSYKKIIERNNLTQEGLAQQIGKSRSYVSNILRILNLDQSIQEMVINKILSYGHAKLLINIEREQAIFFANMFINDSLSVREAEKIIRNYNLTKEIKKRNPPVVNKELLKAYQRIINKNFILPVKINEKEIKIKYKNEEDLKKIMEILNK